MSSVNEKQVGGNHYKNKNLQHWDLVEVYDIPYLEGNGTKYLSRSHLKNGKQDLEKAVHYMEKLLAMRQSGKSSVPALVVHTFCLEQGIPEELRDAVACLFSLWNPGDIRMAIIETEKYIAEKYV